MSSLLDETIEAVVAGLNTAVYQRPLAPRAPTRHKRKTGEDIRHLRAAWILQNTLHQLYAATPAQLWKYPMCIFFFPYTTSAQKVSWRLLLNKSWWCDFFCSAVGGTLYVSFSCFVVMGGWKRWVQSKIQCQHLARSSVFVSSGRRKKVGGKKRTQTKSAAGKKSSGTQLKRRKRLTKKRRGKKKRVRSHVSEFLPVSVCHFQPSVKAA